MRKTLLALSLVAAFSGNSAIAADEVAATTEVKTSTGDSAKLEMPAIKDRRKMLFGFGLFGTGIHVGWKKAKDRGVGSPILFGSVGHKAFGLGTPQKDVIKPES
jgi:hypothetical protein